MHNLPLGASGNIFLQGLKPALEERGIEVVLTANTSGNVMKYVGNPELMNRILGILRENLKSEVRLIELDIAFSDKKFVDEVVKVLDELMKR